MSIQKSVKELIKAINTPKGTEPYDTVAEVVRVDEETAWVHIPGGVDETPVKKTIDAVKGDRVQIRVGGGTAWIAGNESKPPTDDRVANVAKKTAENADLKAILAKKTADDASKVATNYIDFTEEDGLTVGYRDLNSKVNISGDGVKLYDEEGNVGTEIKSGLVQVGQSDSGHTTIQENGMDVYGGDGTVKLAHIGYDLTEGEEGASIAPYYSLGSRIDESAVGRYSMAEGENNRATGECSHAEGKWTAANGYCTHAEGYNTYANVSGAHAEGYGGGRDSSNPYQAIRALGAGSHAEGYAPYSNSAYEVSASGNGAHAEGYGPVYANGRGSHAEGSHTEVTIHGRFAHAEGYGTIADAAAQHVQGRHNVQDSSGAYVDIVGWGDSESSRKNIFALSTGGDGRYKGDVYVGCNNDSTGGNKLSPVILSGVDDSQGCVTIGDLAIEWGVVSITTSSSGVTTGGVTQYLGTAQVTFTNTFAYKPNVFLTWGANYVNQTALNTYAITTTSFYAYGRTLTGETTRSIRWFAIGKKA